ncbi:polysaccharide deacetylase family protein [Candidatus Omnitrophota bacterium]
MKIPLLLYHDIKPDSFDISSVNAELRPYILRESDFLAQMAWLDQNRYSANALNELPGDFNNKTVAIVFDDGWRSNYEIAYPVLSKYGFKATFFITVENVGQQDMMNWDQIREMQNNGMTIGSHNLTHRISVELSDQELNYELSESKNILEKEMNRKVDYFSSPTGFFDVRTEKFAQDNGYKAVCFTKVALNDLSLQENGFRRLNKIGIKRNYSFEVFKGIVEGKKSTLSALRMRQIGRDFAKSLLGPGKYNSFKAVVQRTG